MRALIISALTAVSALSSCSAQAAEEAFQCTASQGTFNRKMRPLPGPTRQVSGEIDISGGDFGAWASVASVQFMNAAPGLSGCACVGIRAQIYKQHPDVIAVYLQHGKDEELLGWTPSENPVTFKLTMDDDSLVTLEVGTGVVKTHVPGFVQQELKLSCSSIKATFTKIVMTPRPV